jgi:hypothetical protein
MGIASPEINYFLSGAATMACLTISVFFLKSWKTTRDRFFLFFSVAFALDAFSRILPVQTNIDDEHKVIIFLIRLCAFIMIICAIISKNWATQKTKP